MNQLGGGQLIQNRPAVLVRHVRESFHRQAL